MYLIAITKFSSPHFTNFTAIYLTSPHSHLTFLTRLTLILSCYYLCTHFQQTVNIL